jgi:hypothetical protein
MQPIARLTEKFADSSNQLPAICGMLKVHLSAYYKILSLSNDIILRYVRYVVLNPIHKTYTLVYYMRIGPQGRKEAQLSAYYNQIAQSRININCGMLLSTTRKHTAKLPAKYTSISLNSNMIYYII